MLIGYLKVWYYFYIFTLSLYRASYLLKRYTKTSWLVVGIKFLLIYTHPLESH